MAQKEEIVARLVDIVGEGWFYERDTEGAASYVAKFGPAPLGVALPASVDELGSIVKAAGEGEFALWVLPNTSGNGGLIGSVGRNVVLLDLSRMNKIIDVDTKAGHALVEPGVTYQQLYDHLNANDTGLWVDCDRNGMNSVSGSICAREYGYTPYGDHLMMQCGMEVMLADGGVVRTGMGAMPKNNTWQLYKYGFGPYIDGLFTQSDLGIVTKIGLWLMPEPPTYQPFMVTLPQLESLAAAVEVMRALKINMIIGNTVVISSPLLDVAPYASRTDFISGDAVDAVAVAEKMNLGEWNLYAALYGTPENVALLWSMIEPALLSIEGSKIYGRDERGDDPVWKNREQLMRGVPAPEMAKIDNWQGSGSIELAITAPLAGEDALQVHKIVTVVLANHGFDYLSEYALAWRSLKNRIYLPFDQTSEDSLARAEGCAGELVNSLAAMGYGVTHTSTGYLPMALKVYAQGGLADLRGRLKTALDPAGVLAPS